MKIGYYIVVLLLMFNNTLFGQTLQEALDSVMTAPELITQPGAKYQDGARSFHMNGGITQTKGGRLWACWLNGEDGPGSSCICNYSNDEGRTWSKPKLVIDPPELANGLHRRVLIAEFWTAPNGSLWLFFDYGLHMFDGRIGVWATVCAQPDAEEVKWSPPVRIAHGSMHNKLIVDREGTWLLPVELYSEQYTSWNKSGIQKYYKDFKGFPELDPERGITIYASRDEGKTWTVRGRQTFPVSAGEEPMLLEKKDGSFWLVVRTPKGMYQSFSYDGCKNWTAPLPAFKNPVTRFYITKLNSGNILFVKQGTMEGEEKKRNRLTAWISEDEGITWKGGLLLDERNNVAYPDGFQAEDGRIFISYEHDRLKGKKSEILFAVFTEEDVLAGKPVSDKVRMKQNVSKATAVE